jgi:hypothetical protein
MYPHMRVGTPAGAWHRHPIRGPEGIIIELRGADRLVGRPGFEPGTDGL